MKQLAREQRFQAVSATKEKVVVAPQPSKNSFAALLDDSDSDSEEPEKPVVSKKRNFKSISWADMEDSDSDEE